MPAPRKILLAEWEDHKDRIVELYLDKHLTLSSCAGREGVIETMEKEGFVATKSQYEAQLRKWGVRKNMKLSEWKSAIPDIESRRQRGEALPIRLSGRTIPSSRINKARRRYRLGGRQVADRATSNNGPQPLRREASSASTQGRQRPLENAGTRAESSPHVEPTAEGVENPENYLNSIEYNVDDVDIDALVDITSQGQPSDGVSLELSVFPSNTFGSEEMHNFFAPLESLVGSTEPSHIQPVSTNLVAADGTNFDDTAPTGLDVVSPAFAFLTNEINAIQRPTVIFPRATWLKQLPSTGFLINAAKDISLKNPAASSHSAVSSIAKYNIVMQFLFDVEEFAPVRSLMNSPSFQTALTSLTSEEIFFEEIHAHSTMLSNDDAFGHRFVGRLMRSTMNGFAGLDGIPLSGVQKFLCGRLNAQSLLDQFLHSGLSHETKSLAENMFRAAIHANDADIVKLLLHHHLVDAENSVCLLWGEIYTPFEMAANEHCLKVVKLLLDLEVDANKSSQPLKSPLSQNIGPALELLIYSHDAHSTFDQNLLDTINHFINAKVMMSLPLVEFTLEKVVDKRVVNRIIDTFASQNPTDASSGTILTQIIRHLDEKDATRIINSIVRMCERLDNQQRLYPSHRSLAHALNEALASSYVDLAETLLITLEKTFRTAAKNGSREGIYTPLENDPDLDDGLGRDTPLAVALKPANRGLIATPEERRVLNRLNSEEIGIDIATAIRAGDILYADKLLNRNVDFDGSDLRNALAITLKNDYDAFAWKLLAAGAHVTARCCDTENERCPIYIAIEKRKSDMVQVMLESEIFHGCVTVWRHQEQCGSPIDAAVHCGDSSILKSVLQAFAIPGSSYSSGLSVSYALKKADRDQFWMILEASAVDTKKSHLSCALMIAVEREDTLLLRQLFDFGASSKDENVLLEAVKRHPSMIEPLLRRFCED
ncbi:hypothetical protein GGR52DRAFT_278980 [Hypoxylon sp. FL1284]|nr:hypothetical protein GGR52DRAFT_278980 [Hypoxylon sp. FL1284]